jgi:alcohol dehydrogenase
MLHPFRVPTRLLMSTGALAHLPEVIAGYSPQRVLLVTDPGLEDTGWPERIWQALAQIDIEAITFDDVEANPRTSTVDRMAEWAKEEGATLVLGVGGGSVLDAAKAAAMVMANGGTAESYEGKDRFTEKPLPFIAVPTTCGTGSEVTWVSVLTVEERHAKISVKGEAMFPDWAVVDPELLRTLPGRLVAWTGMDALTHALEAATGRRSNPVSDTLAADAASLLFRYLRRAADDIEGDDEAREAVMRASTLAGLAFGNADVAAVHCLSETLGGRYDLPHGLANAALLRPVLEYNLPVTYAKLAALAAATGVGTTAEDLLQAVENLLDALDIPGFTAFGIPREDYAWIAERAALNGSNPSNAREMAAEQYLELLEGLG